MSEVIEHIIIVGGGTAGWLTAGLIAAEHPNQQVTLVESPNIPILGVGEGTWPSMRNTLKRIGINERDFMHHCDASFKQGSKFINWCQSETPNHYYHPFMVPDGYQQTDLHACWQRMAPAQSYAETVNMQSSVCDAHLAPKQAQTPDYAAVTNYGYHLDAGKFAQFLQQHCTHQLNITHLLADVIEIENDTDGYISTLITENEYHARERVNGDLFIDCSGSKALLLNKHYGVKLLNQEHVLFNNSAIATQVPYDAPEHEINSATLSTAKAHGWIWDIGLPTRRGIGYTFSDKYTDDETAKQVLIDHVSDIIGVDKANALTYRTLKFTPGYREKFWVKNCLAVGMSSGFIEPLEASALAMVELSISMLSEQLPKNRQQMAITANRFNERFTYRWQRVIEFLKLHYVLSQREDSNYWLDNKSPNTIPERLSELLTLWKHQPPSRYDFVENEEIFSSSSYQYVLYGMHYKTALSDENSSFGNIAAAQHFYQNNKIKTDQFLSGLPTNKVLLAQLVK